MTTGRINQVTIVRRGWPTARVSGRKRCLVTSTAGLLTGTAPTAARPAGPDLPRAASTFPLSISQSAVSRYGSALTSVRVPPQRPKRRPRSQRFSYSASPAGGYLPMLFGRCSNLPTAHRAHPAAFRDESLAPNQAARAPQDRKCGCDVRGLAADAGLSSTHEGTVVPSR